MLNYSRDFSRFDFRSLIRRSACSLTISSTLVFLPLPPPCHAETIWLTLLSDRRPHCPSSPRIPLHLLRPQNTFPGHLFTEGMGERVIGDTPCCSLKMFTSFTLFGFGPDYYSYLNVHQRTKLSFSLMAVLGRIQDTELLPATVQDVQHSTGRCYTMLQPVRSLPVSSDPADYAKTKERDRNKRERERCHRDVYGGEVRK